VESRHNGPQPSTCHDDDDDDGRRRSTLLHVKVACLTSQVAQLLTSRTTNLPDRNHLYSSAISRSVAEL